MECHGEVSIYAAVDVSGSMAGLKCTEICSELQKIIDTCPNNVLLDITLFSTTAWKASTSLKSGIDSAKLMQEIVAACSRKGMTALYDAWGEMMATIPLKVLKNGDVQILVLSDGEDNASEKYTLETAKQLTEKVIRGHQAKFNYIQVGTSTGNVDVLKALQSMSSMKLPVQLQIVEDSAKGIKTAMSSVHNDILSSIRSSNSRKKENNVYPCLPAQSDLKKLNSMFQTIPNQNAYQGSSAPQDLLSTSRPRVQNYSAADLLTSSRGSRSRVSSANNNNTDSQQSKQMDSNKIKNLNVVDSSLSTFCLK